MMDNRVFNVNGRGLPMLRDALMLAFTQCGSGEHPSTAEGWVVLPDRGLVLLWHTEGNRGEQKFPVDMSADESAEMVFKWLSSPAAKQIPCLEGDADADHDGENVMGWRVYVEQCGHVGDQTCAICAIRPSFNWLGK